MSFSSETIRKKTRSSEEYEKGRALFREALAHFRERGGKEFYLFSDNTCDYTFYDAHGLTRVGTDHTFGKSFTVFMYKGPL